MVDCAIDGAFDDDEALGEMCVVGDHQAGQSAGASAQLGAAIFIQGRVKGRWAMAIDADWMAKAAARAENVMREATNEHIALCQLVAHARTDEELQALLILQGAERLARGFYPRRGDRAA